MRSDETQQRVIRTRCRRAVVEVRRFLSAAVDQMVRHRIALFPVMSLSRECLTYCRCDQVFGSAKSWKNAGTGFAVRRSSELSRERVVELTEDCSTNDSTAAAIQKRS